MANMAQDFAELMKQQEQFMNDTIAQLPTPKKKGYMGNNIVILDYTIQTYSAAVAATESMDTQQIRITTYPTKNRIAIIF